MNDLFEESSSEHPCVRVAAGQTVSRTPRQAAGKEVNGLRLRSTSKSSDRLGPCEICHKYVSDVFMRRTSDFQDYVFGHESCLTEHHEYPTAKII